MSLLQPANGGNPSDSLSCPRCHTQLLPQAVFCSSCGERVKKIGDGQTGTEDGEENAQEQNVDTVRVASLSQTQWKRWQASRSPQSSKGSEPSHLNSSLSQDAEAPKSSLLETELPRTEPVDGQAPRQTPMPIELSEPLPTTPVPSIAQTWHQVPDTEVPASTPPGSTWLWPLVIILSALAAALVNLVFTDTAMRPLIVFWFLVVCPGMVLLRFLRLKEPVVEWTLAIALSFAIEALVAGIQLYAGKWSPAAALTILIGLSLAGATAQLVMMVPATGIKMYSILRAIRGLTEKSVHLPPVISRAVKNSTTLPLQGAAQVHRFKKLGMLFLTLFALLVTLLSGVGIGASLWFYTAGEHSPTFTAPSSGSQLAESSPHTTVGSQPTATATPAPVSSPFPNLPRLYTGTLFDIPRSVTTQVSVTSIQQQQGNVSGYFSVPKNNLFSEIPKSGPFQGTVSTAKEVQFTLLDDTGQAAFSFTGSILADSSIQGTYCSLQTAAGKCSDYGLWSVSPAS